MTDSPSDILAALERHGVSFLVIGGLAAIAHGSRRMTRHIDIVVDPHDENLGRLEHALAELGSEALDREGVARPITGADVALVALGATLHTTARAGRLDVVGRPAGAAPFEALRARALVVELAGSRVAVAGLDDLIAMKRASGRPIDLQDIADLTEPEPGAA